MLAKSLRKGLNFIELRSRAGFLRTEWIVLRAFLGKNALLRCRAN
jgi:hypothetical protein